MSNVGNHDMYQEKNKFRFFKVFLGRMRWHLCCIVLIFLTGIIDRGCKPNHSPETIFIQSAGMNKKIPAMVFTPGNYDPHKKKYPVLYLLHGHSSDYAGWTYLQDQLMEWSELNQIILVCPDGDFDSWYIDSPKQPERRYETFIVRELISYIDQHFSSITDKSFRGISGVSMGGHGAVYLSFKYPETFGICGSISGALDLLPFSNEWNLSTLLGPIEDNRNIWESKSCLQILKSSQTVCLPMRIDIGKEDFFIEANRQFKSTLNEMNCPHEYNESEGAHTLEYWTRILPEHLLFFSNHWNNRPTTTEDKFLKK